MFTGLYPSVHGAHYPFVDDESPASISYPLREDVPTLAEFLDAHGYRTAGIAANFAILSNFGLPRGFQHYDVSPGPAYLGTMNAWMYRFRLGGWRSPGEFVRDWLPDALQRRSVMLNRRQPPYRRAREVTDSAQRWLDTNRDRPFFLFLNYFDAHTPYLPPPGDDERFEPRPPGPDWRGFPFDRFNARTWKQGTFTPEEEKYLTGQYDAELVALDREVGRLLQYFRDSRLMQNTLILVTTDHGESLFDRGFLGHGTTLHEAEINGFLIARTPASAKQVRGSAMEVRAAPMMQFVDFFPTIAAVLDVPAPPHVQGSPWGHGRDYAVAELFCRDCAYNAKDGHAAFRRELVAVMIDDHKLIRSEREPDEVYALDDNGPGRDGEEPAAIPAPAPEFLERAEDVLERRNALVVEITRSQPADKESIEKMRSMGYVK
jgi:arylsulfatase A-like enzyme